MTQTQAASSPAETPDVFNGQQPTVAEYSSYRETGELPERFKPEPAGAAPADNQEKTDSEVKTESAGASETPTENQERKPKNAAQRIAQLESAIEAEWGKDEPDVVRIGQLNATIDKINGRPKRKSEAAPPQAAQESIPQSQVNSYVEWEKAFDPGAWIEQYAKDNPNASYEKANAAMFSYMLGARDHFSRIEQQSQAQKQALESQIAEARESYENFDEIKDTFIDEVLDPRGQPKIPVEVLKAINDSPNFTELIYLIGGDEKTLNNFAKLAKSNPTEAVKRVGWFEGQIEEARSGNAEVRAKAPERHRTAAPPPPTPVGGSSGRSFDVNDESLSADDWFKKRNAQLAKR